MSTLLVKILQQQFSLFDLIRTDEPCLYLVLLFSRVPITYLFFTPYLLDSAVPFRELREWTGSQLTGWRHGALHNEEGMSEGKQLPCVQAGGLE